MLIDEIAQFELPTAGLTTGRANATLISLVRNDELEGIIRSMRQLELSWNNKYNYPWIFFNDVPFTEEFKKRTQAETKAQCHYGRSCRRHTFYRRLTGTVSIDSEGALGRP